MSISKKLVKASLQNEAFRKDVIALLRKHGSALSSQEMLAVSAYLVGQMIAFQDQRSLTPAEAMEIALENIALGNKEVIAATLGKTAGRA